MADNNDENKGIPKQVVENDRLAREFVESLGADSDEESSEDSEETDENQDTKEDESDEDKSGDKADDEKSDDDESEESSEEDDTDEKGEGDEEETWQQRYKSLKGMYDKDVPRLNQELRELKSDVFERLGQLTAKAEDADTTEEASDEMPEDIAAFVDEYGPEYIGKLNRYMEYMFGPMLDKGIKPVADKVDDVEDATVKGAQKQFSDYLDTRVEGDWQALMQGEDESFIEFLSTPDPSGLYTMGQLIKMYNDNWDADKLATVLNTYLGVDGKSDEKENVDTEADKAATKKANKKQTTVTPNRKKHSSTPTDTDATIWTQADIKQFEKDDRKGIYTEEESKEKWRDLMKAGIEGRIRD